ncbi:MAG: lipopolysaccharide transport periplasmic protein LptA [Gammaproteobacteria bacterium]|nr:lipopolysaccharide transport periplasmic protein LptA [Gammaproteobacteria bacterium]
MHRNLKNTSGLLLWACLWLGTNTWAAEDPRGEDIQQPVTIEADSAEISERLGQSTYTGNVLLRQGGIELRADRITVFAEQGELRRITASGEPLRFQQLREAEGDVRGSSQRLEYDAISKRLLLLEDARLSQGENRFSGNRIEYDPETRRVLASGRNGEGSPEQPGGRVQVILQPRKPATPAASPP